MMHVFITGGTRGIGRALVLELLKRGHKVSYTGTSETSINKSLTGIVGDYLPLICDVRNKNLIEISASLACDKFGEIDVWINNAGVDQDREDISDLSEVEIKRVIDINITGSVLGTSVALTIMKKQQYGVVYNMEGLGSNNMAIPKTSIYGTSKRAITYFVKAANKELKDYPNVLVGAIQPGMVFTELLQRNLGEDGLKVARILGNKPEHVAVKIVDGIENKKSKISILTNLAIAWRFMSSPFIKRNQDVK